MGSSLPVHWRSTKEREKKIMIPGRIRGSSLNQIFKFVNRNYVGTTFLFSLLADAVAWFVLTMQRILYFDKPFLTTGFYLFNFQFLYFSVHLFFHPFISIDSSVAVQWCDNRTMSVLRAKMSLWAMWPFCDASYRITLRILSRWQLGIVKMLYYYPNGPICVSTKY